MYKPVYLENVKCLYVWLQETVPSWSGNAFPSAQDIMLFQRITLSYVFVQNTPDITADMSY